MSEFICKNFHEDCTALFLTKVKIMIPYTFKLYLTLYGVNFLLFHRKKLTKDFVNSLKKILIKTIKSMLFMATGVLVYRATTCIFSNLFNTTNVWVTVIQSLLCSLASLWEDGKRSLALALFMYPKDAEGIYDLFIKKQWVKEIPYSLSAIFALSMALGVYMKNKGLLFDNYSTLLDKLLY
ncbi:MAG: hypothetical protein ACK5YA_01040 [bacterium]|jgi:hypothetical protein